MNLIGAIGPGPLAIDSAIFIYVIEQHPRYLPLLKPIFLAVDRGLLSAVTSVVTLLETLIVPYRNGDRQLAGQYEAILANARGVTLVPIDPPLVRLAAEIRATTSVKTADALQLATALLSDCSAFLTNDHRLPQLRSIKVLQLEAYL